MAEIQIKTSMKDQLIPIKIAIKKIKCVDGDVEKMEPHALMVGM